MLIVSLFKTDTIWYSQLNIWNKDGRNSLVVQWVGLHTFTVKGLGSILGQADPTGCLAWPKKKKNNNNIYKQPGPTV